MKLALSPELFLDAPPDSLGSATLALAGTTPAMVTLRLLLRSVAPKLRIAILESEGGLREEAVAEELASLASAGHPGLLCLEAAAFNTAVLTSRLEGARRLLGPARGGAVFLRDLHLLSPAAQHALATLLPLANSLWIFSTPLPLRTLRVRGLLSPELLRQLSAVSLRLPPLRERLADLPLFVADLLDRLAATSGLPNPAITPEALALLATHTWPGNFTELDQTLSAALRSLPRDPAPELHPHHLRAALPALPAPPAEADPAPPTPLLLQDVIDSHVTHILHRCGGNKFRAAEMLGISRSTLYRMLEAIATRPLG